MHATFIIRELPADSPVGFGPRGGARALWRYKGHECLIAGPAETGKTWACLHKLNALLWKYPGSQAIMLRKTLASLHTSVLRSYRLVAGHPDTPIRFYGGDKPEWADYPNGSRVFFAGIDNPQKALSSERDFVYVNQAEELRLEDWEVLTTRCTGRAGNAPYAQIFGDCNPGPPTHWILHRPSLKVFESRHEDNPVLFDDDGAITEQGQRTLAILDRLTGVRKERLRFGRWVQAEGVVYEEWDRAVHLIDPFPIPAGWRRIRSIDFGYVNPTSVGWYAIDGDGRMYLYREIYYTGRTVADHARQIIALTGDEDIEATVADHDAEDRATLHAYGISTVPAIKAISPGLQAVRERLIDAGDGRPRLFIFRDALVEQDPALVAARRPACTADEFEVYSFPKGQDGRTIKEVPIKVNDHGMDKLRYAVMYVDSDPGPFTPIAGGTRPVIDAGVPGWPTQGLSY